MLSFYWIVSGSTTLEKWSDYRKCSQGLHESHPGRFSWRTNNDSLHAQSHFTSLLRKYFLFIKNEYLHVSELLSFFFQEFRDIFPEELTEMLIDNICLLVTSQSREVVNPSISFLHVFVQVQPVMESAKFCEKIVNSLCKMTEDCKRHFRLKTR